MTYSKKQIIISLLSILIGAYLVSSHIITDANGTVKEEALKGVEIGEKGRIASPKSTTGPLYVYLTGAIERPGLYEVPGDTTLQAVVEKSGGFLPYAQMEAIPLGEVVKESAHFHVPFNFQGNPEELVRKNLLSINRASEEELKQLPGIGPAMAKRIVEYRTKEGGFSTLEELKQVKGIGDKLFQKLEGKVGL